MNRRLAPLLALFAVGCSRPDPDATVPLAALAEAESFRPLSDALGTGCASLDCHGQPGRNLRLYDARGLRLDPADSPGNGATTDAELAANHRSLVGLEPALTDTVLTEAGARPERLTVVRKARGAESHKGGSIWFPGSPGDRCLVSWLAGTLDPEACTAAATVEPIPDP